MKAYLYLLACLALLAGCAAPRPPSLDCGLKDFAENSWGSGGIWGLQSPNAPPRPLNVLALSAGGANGAYGAGLLRGWRAAHSAQPVATGDIHVVTGVSTGAILATHVFLERYDEIDKIYRSISGNDIYRQRSIFGMLFGGNSVLTTEGKRALIKENLTTDIINAVAERGLGTAGAKGLYIGAVNMDTGTFYRVNMVALARASFDGKGGKARRDQCFHAVIDASSAIPIAFEPVFIDGNMYADGGARYYTFMHNLAEQDQGDGVKRRLFTIVHSELQVAPSCIENGLLSIAARTFDLFTDEAAKDAMLRMEYAATRLGPKSRFETFYADAADAALSVQCQAKRRECGVGSSPTGEDMFCKPFMACLADQGYADGRKLNTANWQEVWRPIEKMTLGSRGTPPAPFTCR